MRVVKEKPLKHLLAVAALSLAASSALHAQSLEEKREAKLKSPFLQKASWLTDYDAALAEAKKSGRLIFGYFTRSYSP
jgi:hypothetical protein